MISKSPKNPTRDGFPAVTLECAVRASPNLARLIRKSAEKEASGASATDALLIAAGLHPGELESLRKAVERLSKESEQWRDRAARESDQLNQTKSAAVESDKERAAIRGDLRKATDALKAAQQQSLTLEARIAELASAIESRDEQLASSLSLHDLDDSSVAALRALRNRLAQGEIPLARDAEGLIANLHRSEMKALVEMLTHDGWRLQIVRWLLRARAAE